MNTHHLMRMHAVWLVLLAATSPVGAISIEFDYSYDANGFFADPARRATLETAGQVYEDLLADDLDPIQAGSSGLGYDNTWEAMFDDPAGGQLVTITDLSVAADTLVVFVGGRDLGGGELARGGPGGVGGTGSDEWLDTIRGRGEEHGFGSGATDFGPWGGFITFDTRLDPYAPPSSGGGLPFITDPGGGYDPDARDWNFNPDAEPDPWQNDFYTVAVHELAHVLGFGTSESWNTYVDAGNALYTGPTAASQNAGPVGLDGTLGHWQADTTHHVFPDGTLQPALMNPDVEAGESRSLTNLDVAALVDVGWELTTEPEDPTLVVGRHVFYNNSAYDGNSWLADERDDGAIATDKNALLPGEQAAFENYTSFDKGLNGIVIDVRNLAEPDSLNLADFEFRIGGGTDLALWDNAPDPAMLAVRHGDGLGGADRVTLVWLDGQIQNQWLEVTLLSGDTTGLSNNDVFYFGNIIAETGNSTGNAMVTSSDLIDTRDNPRGLANPASITDPYDLNRDGFVDSRDIVLVRENLDSPLGGVPLISVDPIAEGAPASVPEPASWLLAAIGLLLLGSTAARRSTSARHRRLATAPVRSASAPLSRRR